ncbi:MAG: hypothetical protein ACTSRU_14180 [Candidatus Hodarchaeales archaeon]
MKEILMSEVYKLTDKDDKTFGGCQWGPGISNPHGEKDGKKKLCSSSWYHAYRTPILAVLMNPIQGDFDEDTMHLWKCEGKVGKDDGAKIGCSTLITIERIEVPTISIEQRIRFAILCVKEVHIDKMWNEWADRWISGEERGRKAACAATRMSTGLAKSVSCVVVWEMESECEIEAELEVAASAASTARRVSLMGIDLIPIYEKAMK